MSGLSPVSCVPYQPVDQATPSTGPASADLNGDGVLDPFEQQQAAVSLAPVLYFAPGEENFLQDPMTYIEESSLRQELDWRPDREVHDEGDVPPEELADIDDGNPDADSQLFLDHSDDHRAGDNDNSALLYEYDADTNTITYHLFYSYNDGPPGLGDVQNHEGDWERVTIQLDDQFRPSEVRYSAHSGLDVSRAWPGAENSSGQPVATLENGKPVVYVAQGSHANLPETGAWSTQVDGIHDIAAYDPDTPGARRDRRAVVRRLRTVGRTRQRPGIRRRRDQRPYRTFRIEGTDHRCHAARTAERAGSGHAAMVVAASDWPGAATVLLSPAAVHFVHAGMTP
jgi:hypothetical protein